MKLSFVIPAYNEEKYISKCLDSLVKQTIGSSNDIEIIVVNNASTDETKGIASSFPGVLVIDEPIKGLVRARQAGYKACGGDLVANIDADAVVPPGWIERVFKEFSADPELVALSGPYVYYDLPLATNALAHLFYAAGYGIYLINHYVLRKGGMLQGGNFVLKRTALEKIGGYNTNIEFYGEDTDIARRIQSCGKILFTFKHKMYTSGRRLAKEGLLVMGWKYGMNYFWMLIFNKPFTKDYIDVR